MNIEINVLKPELKQRKVLGKGRKLSQILNLSTGYLFYGVDWWRFTHLFIQNLADFLRDNRGKGKKLSQISKLFYLLFILWSWLVKNHPPVHQELGGLFARQQRKRKELSQILLSKPFYLLFILWSWMVKIHEPVHLELGGLFAKQQRTHGEQCTRPDLPRDPDLNSKGNSCL